LDNDFGEQDIVKTASDLGITLKPGETRAYADLIAGTVAAYRRLAGLITPPAARLPRRTYRQPDGDEDPCNAFAVFTEIAGAAEGPLSGFRIALKDTIAVADIPLGVGTSILDGFLPSEDATVASRVLTAGGTIVGKTNCECLCASGASFTSSRGVVRNPHRATHSAGGSSSGSAVAVAMGLADVAIGGDQGGSIRVPAACCGIVGLKPTFGLVPYSGAFSGDAAIDHLGPMSRSVEDNARLLRVIAGADGVDPRQRIPGNYSLDFRGVVDSLRISLVAEGFGSGSMVDVADLVRVTVGRTANFGITVKETSIPLHSEGMTIWLPIILEGTLASLLADGAPPGVGGLHMPDFVRRLGSWKRNPQALSDVLRVLLVAGRASSHVKEMLVTRPPTKWVDIWPPPTTRPSPKPMSLRCRP
jgi:amidase